MTISRATLAAFITCCALGLNLVMPAFADPEDEREGGILGTGIAPIGIIGTVTHLGSIHVNGQHIRFARDLPLADGSAVHYARDLRPNHTVAVIATPDPAGADNWQAQHIRQITPLVGPLTITPEGRLSVLNTEITPPTALLAQHGDWVAVSGLWQDHRVIASRIDILPSPGTARIEGSAMMHAGRLMVGGTEITGLTPQHLSDGDVIRVEGTPAEQGITASLLEVGSFNTAPSLTLIEGYLSPPSPSGRYSVLGSGLISYTDNPAMIDPLLRVFACGRGNRLTDVQTTNSAPTCQLPPQD